VEHFALLGLAEDADSLVVRHSCGSNSIVIPPNSQRPRIRYVRLGRKLPSCTGAVWTSAVFSDIGREEGICDIPAVRVRIRVSSLSVART